MLSEINKNINKEELGILIQLLGENCVRNLNDHCEFDKDNNIIVKDVKVKDIPTISSQSNSMKNIVKENVKEPEQQGNYIIKY